MTLNKKYLSVVLAVLGLLAVILLSSHSVFAAGTDTSLPNFGTGAAGTPTGDTQRLTAATDSTAIGAIITTMYNVGKYLSALIFGVAVIVIVWAGFKYATSQGETKTMESAKMQIIAAGIGIGVTLLAMIIVKVFYEVFGTKTAATS